MRCVVGLKWLWFIDSSLPKTIYDYRKYRRWRGDCSSWRVGEVGEVGDRVEGVVRNGGFVRLLEERDWNKKERVLKMLGKEF